MRKCPLQSQKETVGLARGRPVISTEGELISKPPTLADAGK